MQMFCRNNYGAQEYKMAVYKNLFEFISFNAASKQIA